MSYKHNVKVTGGAKIIIKTSQDNQNTLRPESYEVKLKHNRD